MGAFLEKHPLDFSRTRDRQTCQASSSRLHLPRSSLGRYGVVLPWARPARRRAERRRADGLPDEGPTSPRV